MRKHTHTTGSIDNAEEGKTAPAGKKERGRDGRDRVARARGMHTHAKMHACTLTHAHTHKCTHTHGTTHTRRTHADAELELFVEKLGPYREWTGAKGCYKLAAAAKHNNALAERIFNQVAAKKKKKGDPDERRKYSLETLKWYAKVFAHAAPEELLKYKNDHEARAGLRKWYMRGTNTACMIERVGYELIAKH